MTRKSKKTELLEIMKTILQEYEDCTHRADITKCGLCVTYMDKDDFSCDKCPMDIFYVEAGHFYPCMNRNCRPLSCYPDTTSNDKDLQQVIEFYKQAIAKTESMSVDAVRKSKFKFLIKIDKEINKKY